MRTITESESTPRVDGFHMPAEFEPQDRVFGRPRNAFSRSRPGRQINQCDVRRCSQFVVQQGEVLHRLLPRAAAEAREGRRQARPRARDAVAQSASHGEERQEPKEGSRGTNTMEKGTAAGRQGEGAKTAAWLHGACLAGISVWKLERIGFPSDVVGAVRILADGMPQDGTHDDERGMAMTAEEHIAAEVLAAWSLRCPDVRMLGEEDGMPGVATA